MSETQDAVVIGDDRKDFDPAVADQLTQQTLLRGLHNIEVNGAAARSTLQNTLNAFTLNVQEINAAMTEHLNSMSPIDAAVLEDLQKQQSPAHVASENAAAEVG